MYGKNKYTFKLSDKYQTGADRGRAEEDIFSSITATVSDANRHPTQSHENSLLMSLALIKRSKVSTSSLEGKRCPLLLERWYFALTLIRISRQMGRSR